MSPSSLASEPDPLPPLNHAPPAPGRTAACWPPGRSRHGTGRSSCPAVHPSAQDRAFIALQNAHRPYGGLARLPELRAARRARAQAREWDIERQLDAGELFAFAWHGVLWVPMFQLDRPSLAVAPTPQRVVAELGPRFDGWDLAHWFVKPNVWLARRCPVECLGGRLEDVLQAARADRFVLTG